MYIHTLRGLRHLTNIISISDALMMTLACF